MRKPAPPVMRRSSSASRRPSGAWTVPSSVPVVNCAGSDAGSTYTVTKRSRNRRKTEGSRLRPKHGEAANGVPKRASHEDIQQEVCRQASSRAYRELA